MHAAVRRTTPLGPWGEEDPAPAVAPPAGTGWRQMRADGTEWLVHRRRTRTGAARVWAAITEPDQVRRWAGTLRRDPLTGTVQFWFTFEGDDLLPVTCTVDELVPGRWLAVTMTGPVEEDEPQRFEIELRELLLVTELVVAQRVTSSDAAPHLASGCEYYVDRLLAMLDGRDPASLDFDDYFLQQADHYRRLFPEQRAGSARG